MLVSRRTLTRYSSAVAIVVVAALVRWFLDPVLNDRASFITFIMAVAITSWLGGVGPGLVALVLGGLAANYFFIKPRGTLGWMKEAHALGILLYFITDLILILLAESQRRARARAEESAREALDRQALLEAEVARRERVERERSGLLAEQARLRADAEEQSLTLASLFDQAPVGIFLYDANLRHLKANRQAAALIGQTPDRVIGRTMGELLGELAPESRIAELERLYRTTIETGVPLSGKEWALEIRRPEPSVLYLDWSIRRVERPGGGMLGLLATFADVTEDVQRGQALRKSEELFRLAADAVDGLIYDVDMTTNRVERTRGLYELLGYQPDEVPPTYDWWLEQVHPEDLGRLLDEAARLRGSGGRSITEYRVRHRDGHYVHVLDRSLAAIDEGGNVGRYVGCTQDVTEIRQAEQSLREADRRKDEFLAVLAHEIRNPLASIRNSLRLMKRPEIDPNGAGEGEPNEVEHERLLAERQVAHLARLIDDLMDVSRIGRGLIVLRREIVELAPVVRRAVEAAASPLRERGHELSVELPSGAVLLEADATRLEQVIGNLLSNAIKYTRPGGRIGLSAKVEGGEVVLNVRDSGLGIDPEMLPKIFGMFVQDGSNSGHAQGGLGIGLGLARSLVELHGGSISARSEGPGLGSHFEVRLPLATPATSSQACDPGRNGRATLVPTLPRKRVLVVDDNEAIALSLARILSRIYGQEVRVAHDGLAALDLADEFHPEVILLDIGMPLMDGCELARRLRERPEFASTLLVALTGWGQEADRRRSEEAGIDRHLVKPVDPDMLAELISGGARN